ncbi:MAG: long-chain fatty acid--CoA ligase [Chlorobiaceae bacterium]|nr:long-chain fatty acid--CoA ligase [Chlorobiaceae bacterium]
MDPVSDDLLFDLGQIKSGSQAIIYHDKDLVVNYDELNRVILNKICYLLDNNILPGSNTVLKVKDPWIDLQNYLALTYIGSGVYCPLGNSEIEKDVVRCIDAEFTISDSLDFIWTKYFIDSDTVCSEENNKRYDELSRSVDSQTLSLVWFIRSSSGTTGKSKIFKLSRKDLLSRRRRYYDAVRIQPGDLFYSFTPTRFGAARQRVYYSLTAGAAVLFIDEGANLVEIIRLINYYKVTHLYCVPMHLEVLCKHAENNKHQDILFPYVKSLETTSSLVSPLLREKVVKLLTPNFIIAYSVSELGHISSTRKSKMSDLLINDIGFPVCGVDVSIYDNSNNKLQDGLVGRIGVSVNDDVFNGYFDKSKDNDKDGCGSKGIFFPGDLAYISKNNNIIFQGREDDLMIFNGINIYPYEIESALKSLPEVSDAVAFPLPSTVHCQVPCAAVILKTNVDFNVLLSKCRGLIGARSPQYLFFVKNFPKNQMGKVLRTELQKIAIDCFSNKK